MTIGEQIKNFREQAHLKQKDLADLTGYSRSSIINWENGYRNPTFDVLEHIASVLHVSVHTLTGGVEDRSSIAVVPSEPPATASGKVLDALVRRLAEKDPDIVLLFVQPFTDAEVEILTGAFRGVAAMRAELKKEKERRSTTPIADDRPLGVENGKNHVS